MKPQGKPNNGNPLTPDFIEKFIEVQRQEALNKAEELKLKVKELEHNSKFAEQSLNLQAQLEFNNPKELRKNITRVAYIFAAFFIVFLLFIIYCLHFNHKEFAVAFLEKAGYLLSLGIGYFLGSRQKKKQNEKEEDDEYDQIS